MTGWRGGEWGEGEESCFLVDDTVIVKPRLDGATQGSLNVFEIYYYYYFCY